MLQGKHLGKHQVKICGIKVQKSANEENGEKNCIGPVTIYTLTIIHSDPLFVKIFIQVKKAKHFITLGFREISNCFTYKPFLTFSLKNAGLGTYA